MSKHTKLMAAMDNAASILGVQTTTLGRMVGQGGWFYSRLSDGKRVWPETERKVRHKLRQLIREHKAKK